MCEFCDNTFFLSRKRAIQLNKELNVNDVVNNAINQLYDDRVIDDDTKKALLQSNYQPLKEAVEEGYGKQLMQIEYGTPNYEFLKQLQTNTAVFASFKNHASIKEMVALLKDEQGNLRSRDSFKQEALKIDATYRGSKLDAEYDTAVRQARMAANWQKYEKNKRLYPNLRYVLTKAAKPDEKHMQYVGIVQPVDSVFWSTHYPPNRWRCQCSVEQTDDDTTDVPNNLPTVPDEFAFNSGKLGQVFDIKNSDYAKGTTAAEKVKLLKDAEKIINYEVAKNAPYTTIYKSKSGNTVQTHPLSYEAPDFEKNVANFRDLANSKLPIGSIKIAPYLNKYEELRVSLLPNSKGKHNPDGIVNDKYIDGKTPSKEKASKNTIKHSISEANKQADGIVLLIENETYISKKDLFNDIKMKYIHDAYANFIMYIKHQDEWFWFKNKEDFFKQYNAQKKH